MLRDESGLATWSVMDIIYAKKQVNYRSKNNNVLRDHVVALRRAAVGRLSYVG